MSDDRNLPVVQPSAFDAGMIATLRRELAERTHMADVWRKVAHAKQQTVDEQRALIEELRAENERLVPDAKQAHARNDEMVHEHFALRREIRELTAERGKLMETVRKAAYDAVCHIVDRDRAAGVDDNGIIDNVLAELSEPIAIPYATPAEDRKTPGKSDQESPAAASGEKPNTGHPAGGRAPILACGCDLSDGGHKCVPQQRASACVHHAEWPAFPFNAISGKTWKPGLL